MISFRCFLFVRSDEEITHNCNWFMICDVHFGDTRYDYTPATKKWLPNDHTEEQYTTNKTHRLHGQKNAIGTFRILTSLSLPPPSPSSPPLLRVAIKTPQVEGGGPTFTDGTTICAICLDTLSPSTPVVNDDPSSPTSPPEPCEDQVGTLARCGHRYHKECMGIWLRGKKKRDAVCPECRTRVVE